MRRGKQSFASRARSYRSSALASDLSFIGINRKVSLCCCWLLLAALRLNLEQWQLSFPLYGFLLLAVFYAS